MKTKFFLIASLLSITFTKSIISQEINPLDFFPHHVGDLWQYFTYTQVSTEFTQIEVISVDTSYTDSSITITKFDGVHEFSFKIKLNDSLKIYQKSFGEWGILYDFGAEINSFWISDPYFPYYTKYISEYMDEVFGDSLITREYWTAGDTLFNLALWTDHIALGIGSYKGEFEVGITVLNGCIINGVQYGIILNVEDENTINPPKEFLLNNYPNPFNPQTKIKFYVPERTFVKLRVFDLLGDELEILVNEEKDSGYHEIVFDGSELPSGIYFYTLQTQDFIQTRKMVLLK